jgi:phage shock protein C
MSSRRGRFRLNKQEAKIMGVCAGLADHFDIDVTLVRIAMVLALIVTFPVVGFAYLVMGMVAEAGSSRRMEYSHGSRLSTQSVEATRARMRDLDARMQAMESYVTSSNVQLAKEIDELR